MPLPTALLPLSLLLAALPPTIQSVPAAPEAAGFDHAHAAWSAVLARHVHGDRFDYAALKKDPAPLAAYLDALEAVQLEELAGWTEKQRFAYWINAYNAYTVKRVVDAYPIASLRDLARGEVSVWDQKWIPLGRLFPEAQGEELTLNDIENRILRPAFEDARVHAAINCASEGCPPLRAEAFRAADLDTQLGEQTRRWLADPERNRFDARKKELSVSRVFEWFAADFEREADGVVAWIAERAPAEHQEWLRAASDLKPKYLEYSWKLNDVPREGR